MSGNESKSNLHFTEKQTANNFKEISIFRLSSGCFPRVEFQFHERFLHNNMIWLFAQQQREKKKIKSSMSLRLQLDLMMKINENVKEKFFELGRPKWQGRRRCLNIDAVLHCTTMIHECYANALKWKQFCTCRTAMARTSLQEQPKTTRANSQLHLVFTVTLCCKYKNA